MVITNRSGWLLELLTELKMAIYCPQGSGTLRQQYTLLFSVILCFTLLRRVSMFLLGTLAFVDNTATSVEFIIVVAMSKTCEWLIF